MSGLYSDLWEAVSSGEKISPRAVERVFQNAIFGSGYLEKRFSEFSARLDQALRVLRLHLTAAPQRFLVYCPVNGLAPEGLPSRVGNVEFVVFGNEQLDQFRAAVAMHNVDQEERESRRLGVDKLAQEKTLSVM